MNLTVRFAARKLSAGVRKRWRLPAQTGEVENPRDDDGSGLGKELKKRLMADLQEKSVEIADVGRAVSSASPNRGDTIWERESTRRL